MRRILVLLLCGVAFLATFLVVGCSGGGSQGQEGGHEQHATHREEHAAHQQGHDVKITLRPKHNSAVSGLASFKDASDGVLVTLKLRDLPKPETFYLAHIHPGPCAEEGAAHAEHADEARQHGEHRAEQRAGQKHSGHEHGAQIDYPLSQVKSDSEGRGSSTTTLGETSVDKLFSGKPKHVNVHEAGSGNPPILTCAELEQAG